MSILDRYQNQTPGHLAERIAFAILTDINDRSGLSNEMDNVDRETKCEMLNTWVEDINRELNAERLADINKIFSMSSGLGIWI